jgi:hypothetical protein
MSDWRASRSVTDASSFDAAGRVRKMPSKGFLVGVPGCNANEKLQRRLMQRSGEFRPSNEHAGCGDAISNARRIPALRVLRAHPVAAGSIVTSE